MNANPRADNPEPFSPSGPPGRPSVFDAQGFMRKYIPFASNFVTGQKSGRGQDLTAAFTAANTDTSFTIALGHIPTRVVTQGATVGGSVFNGSNQRTDWTAKVIVLRATAIGTYRLWIG